jgi:hypothetical protein
MAKPNYQYEKRQKDLAKQRKRQEKEQERAQRKAAGKDTGVTPDGPDAPGVPPPVGEATQESA